MVVSKSHVSDALQSIYKLDKTWTINVLHEKKGQTTGANAQNLYAEGLFISRPDFRALNHSEKMKAMSHFKTNMLVNDDEAWDIKRRYQLGRAMRINFQK